jgi:HEAT repeat protein
MSESARAGTTRDPAAIAAIGIMIAVATVVIAGAMLLPSNDIWVRVAISLASIETVVAFVLLPGLICAKHVRAGLEHRSSRRRNRILKWLANPADANQAQTAAVQWPDDFLGVLQHALSALSGSEKIRLANVVQASGLLPRLVREATGRDANHAVRAIRILSAMDDEPARTAIRDAIEHGSALVRVTAKRAVLTGADNAAKLKVLRSLAEAHLWERVILYYAAADDPALLPAFAAEAFNVGDDDQILLALEMIYSRTSFTPCAAPQSLADSANVEIRIRIFKALPFLHFEGELTSILRKGLNDADWRVRAMAAKACSRLNEPALTDDLFRLCSVFENPAEASHAARALAAIGGKALLRLETLARSESRIQRGIAAETVEAQWVREGAA